MRASLLVCFLAACSRDLPPQGQLLLYVDTDATLPGPNEPSPLFDTLVVDVFAPNETTPCGGCSRTFGLDADRVGRREASFGIPAPPDVAGYRVRLRLFRAASTASGSLSVSTDAPWVIDTTARLPPAPAEGIAEVSIVLRTDDVGVPVGSLDEPVDVTPSRPAISLVGSWPGAKRVGCADPASSGEVCVPGGAFWMGNARVRGNGVGDGADRPRLVIVSPFYMGATEVTVAAYRAFGKPSYAWSGVTGAQWQDDCTFTAAPGPHEDLPVNCLDWSEARAYCQSLGGDLPTEAQFEWVASGQRSTLFIWGDDDPSSCDDAVVFRAGWGFLASLAQACKPTQPPDGALPVGSKVALRRDHLTIDGATLFDLVGNTSEWVRDRWNRQTEPCWGGGGVHRDPECTMPSPADGDMHAYRGGSWVTSAHQAAAAVRGHLTGIAGGQGIDLGFRCVRPSAPKK